MQKEEDFTEPHRGGRARCQKKIKEKNRPAPKECKPWEKRTAPRGFTKDRLHGEEKRKALQRGENTFVKP